MTLRFCFERIEEDFEKFHLIIKEFGKWPIPFQEALKNVDAVLILTAWDEFFGLDWNYWLL